MTIRRGLAALATLALVAMLMGAAPLELAPPEAALELRSLDGEPVDLAAEIRDHEATVLVWWGATCPCVRRYQERMEGLRDLFPEDRVLVLAVASNAGDTPERVRQVAAERDLDLPLYMDPQGRLARRLGARTTPTTAVLDGEGRLRFLGWIDNERLPGARGREAWVEEAVHAVLEGEKARAASPVYGCPITRSLSEPASCTTEGS